MFSKELVKASDIILHRSDLEGSRGEWKEALRDELGKPDWTTGSRKHPCCWEVEQDMWFRPDDSKRVVEISRKRNVFIVGDSGSGKSPVLAQAAWALSEQGRWVMAWSAKGPAVTDNNPQLAAHYGDFCKTLKSLCTDKLALLVYRPVVCIDNFDYLLRRSGIFGRSDYPAAEVRKTILDLVCQTPNLRLIATVHGNYDRQATDLELEFKYYKSMKPKSIYSLL